MVQRMTDTADVLDLATPFGRAMAALLDPHATFTPDQLSWYMGEAARWAYEAGFDEGYRARVAEENAAYPPAPTLVISDSDGHKVWMDQVDYRRRCDAEALRPRRTDFRPGRRLRPWPPDWCGDETPHERHITTPDDGERFRCKGRQAHA